jgi:hypothetical protein
MIQANTAIRHTHNDPLATHPETIPLPVYDRCFYLLFSYCFGVLWS